MAEFPIDVNFSQATPKPEGVWAQKGSMGPRYEQEPKMSEAPATGFVEADDAVEDPRIRGYHTPGEGGNDSLTDKGVSRSQMS